MKALIIDPSASYRRMVAAVVNDAGFEAVVSSSGEEAIELLEQYSFDVVLSAMHLNDMSAPLLASKLRSDKNTHQVPFILVTSSEDKASLEMALTLGVTEIFSKSEPDKISEYLVMLALQKGEGELLNGRVLYIEDAKSVAGKVMALLAEKGLTVDHFVTGEEALEVIKSDAYDLVLTDVMLDGKMSGYGFVREVRGLEGGNSRIPILVMSGFNDDTRKIELLRSGANDFISKPVLDEELLARVSNLIISKKLIDKISSQQARLHDMAMKDQLTGLYNRHFLMESAPKMLSEAYRHKIPYSLIMVDADKFKNINDTYGHQTGDEVLMALSKTILKACREEDIPARFGGEEFVVLLSHCDGENAVKKAEALRKAIESLKPAGLDVTASFGVAEFSLDKQSSFDDLFKVADEAVYEAKEAGRNKVILG